MEKYSLFIGANIPGYKNTHRLYYNYNYPSFADAYRRLNTWMENCVDEIGGLKYEGVNLTKITATIYKGTHKVYETTLYTDDIPSAEFSYLNAILEITTPEGKTIRAKLIDYSGGIVNHCICYHKNTLFSIDATYINGKLEFSKYTILCKDVVIPIFDNTLNNY